MKNFSKTYWLFVFLFLSISATSQSIEVSYKMISQFDSDRLNEINGNLDKDALDEFNQAFELISKLKMKLKANKGEAFYFGDNVLSNDIDGYIFQMAKIIIENDSKYYYNLKLNEVSKWFNAYGENLLLKTNVDSIKWTLTKEKKKIGNYVCYKANLNYVTTNSKGDFKKNVIAWYTPEIPFSFGPKGFCNLPGLIIELADDKITYVAEEIIFNKKDLQMEKLPKGKIITQDELNEIGKKAIELRNEMYKKKN
jgi:GLPGLI family protein